MNLLVSICDPTYQPIWNVVGLVIKTLWIGIPILLIILGTLDLGKAVISSKEDEVKKAKKSFINRLIYAILVFAVVWIVKVVLGIIASIGVAGDTAGNGEPEKNVSTKGWVDCWNAAMNSK